MAADPTLMDKLNRTDEIEGDVINKLDDYIGSHGHYTPEIIVIGFLYAHRSPCETTCRIVSLRLPGVNEWLFVGLMYKSFWFLLSKSSVSKTISCKSCQ